MTRSWMIFLTILIVSVDASSMVDMQTAGYIDTWVDAKFPGPGFALKIQRTYNSRSNFTGLFGFGWCSNFEIRIEKNVEKNSDPITIFECGDGQRSNYSLVTGSKFKSNPKPRFRSKLASLGEVIETADGYVRSFPDSTLQKFDRSGHLTEIHDRNGNWLKLGWDGGKLKEVVDNLARKMSFTYPPGSARVEKITGPGGTSAEYKYSHDLLLSNEDASRRKFAYEYDRARNLTKINFSDKTFRALTYDQNKDRVIRFSENEECVEEYKYEMSSSRSNLSVRAEKKCDGKSVRTALFEFVVNAPAKGQRQLASIAVTSGHAKSEMFFDPELQRPLSSQVDGIKTEWAYDDQGRVILRTTSNVKTTYRYEERHGKVARVETQTFEGKTRLISNSWIAFDYDHRGNLKLARDSRGKSTQVTFDSQGRIGSFLDQKKRKLMIRYAGSSDQPDHILLDRVGSLKFHYDGQGKLKKSSSTGGVKVADEVAASFYSLLELVRPSTEEVGL